MSPLARLVAALLFSSPDPVGERELAEALECDPADLAEALAEVEAQFADETLGIVLRKVAGGYINAGGKGHSRAGGCIAEDGKIIRACVSGRHVGLAITVKIREGEVDRSSAGSKVLPGCE